MKGQQTLQNAAEPKAAAHVGSFSYSCFLWFFAQPLKLLKKFLFPSSCSIMAFVFNFYQYGDSHTTPPRPRPKTAARPLPALLPPGNWSEPTRRRRRDDPADAGDRRGRSHSPRHRRRRRSRSPRRTTGSPLTSSTKISVSKSPSVPPGNFIPPGHFPAPRPPFFQGPQTFVPPQGHQPPRAPMPTGHPWPRPPRQQFRPRSEQVPQAPPAPKPTQTIHGLRKTKVLDRQCQRLRHSRKLLMSFWTIC